MKFIEELQSGIPEEAKGYFLLWNKNGESKTSHWYPIGQEANIQDMVGDVYIGVCTSPKDFGQSQRCKSQDTAGMMGLWLDVDILDPVHKKPNLPPDKETALSLIESILPLGPSIVVNSGHGLQLWWLFKEYWAFDDVREREEGARLAKRFVHTFRQAFDKKGYDIDAVHDLARVMRLPGTMNCKQKPFKKVTMNKPTGNRYNPSDIEGFLLAEPRIQMAKPLPKGNLILDPNAVPPFTKWEVLKTLDKGVEQAWENKKAIQDKSASGYDMALANYAASVEWTDQEICNLLVAHRAKHGHDLKLNRVDYYRRTIAKARELTSQETHQEEIADIVREYATTPKQDIPEDQIKVGLEHVSSILGVEITKVIRYTSDPPTYAIETTFGRANLGTIESLTGQTKARNFIAARTGKWVRKKTAGIWDNVVQLLLNAVEIEDIGSEATTQGLGEAWLHKYLLGNTIRPVSSPEGLPYWYNEYQLAVQGATVRDWLLLNNSEKTGLSAREFGITMKVVGCKVGKLDTKVGGKRTSRSIWILPQALSLIYKED